MNDYIEFFDMLPNLLPSPSKIFCWWVLPVEKLEGFFQFFLYILSNIFNMFQDSKGEKESIQLFIQLLIEITRKLIQLDMYRELTLE